MVYQASVKRSGLTPHSSLFLLGVENEDVGEHHMFHHSYGLLGNNAIAPITLEYWWSTKSRTSTLNCAYFASDDGRIMQVLGGRLGDAIHLEYRMVARRD